MQILSTITKEFGGKFFPAGERAAARAQYDAPAPACNTEYIRIFSKQYTKDPIFEIYPIFGFLLDF